MNPRRFLLTLGFAELAIMIPALAILLLASGCAINPSTGLIDVSQTQLATVTHADLKGAAKVASDSAAATTDPALKAALLARSNWWTQQEAMLTAREGQVSACLNAIAASKPKLSGGQSAGIFTSIEVAAEAVGNFSGMTAAVKLACEPLPIPTLPAIIKP